MDYLGKGEILINTDLDKFMNIIWEKKAHEIGFFSSWKMGAKTKALC